MEIKIFGAGMVVTGSCYGIHTDKNKILVDCGMFQGGKDLEKKNYDDFGFDPIEYKAVVLTHAHLDHCGRIPKLVKLGFTGTIYATDATRDLAEVVLLDAANIAAYDTKKENFRREKKGQPKREPLYTEEDVKKALSLFKTVSYDNPTQVTDDINVVYHEAGHILGAASVQLTIQDNEEKKTIAFSGDIGQENPILVKEKQEFDDTDYVFCESTYGDRLHPKVEERKQKLLQVILDTHKKGGILMIPSFAIERTQELLYEINGFVEKNLIPEMNVYLDSPMAIKATEVFKKHPEFYNDELRQLVESGDDPFHFHGLTYTPSVDESKGILNDKKPHIIIAGSGMCTAGRIKHHILNHIGDEKNTILFVGYQAYGTLGYWIRKGEQRIRLLGKQAEVKAKVEDIEGYSGHADYENLLNWLKNMKPKPKKVFLIHGEEDSLKSMSEKVTVLGMDNRIPRMMDIIKL